MSTTFTSSRTGAGFPEFAEPQPMTTGAAGWRNVAAKGVRSVIQSQTESALQAAQAAAAQVAARVNAQAEAQAHAQIEAQRAAAEAAALAAAQTAVRAATEASDLASARALAEKASRSLNRAPAAIPPPTPSPGPGAGAGAGPATPTAPMILQKMQIPEEFGLENEHPVLPIPFKATLGDQKLEGAEISVTAAYVKIPGQMDPAWKGHRDVVKLQFDFAGFTMSLFPECVVTGSREEGEMTLQFLDPTGPHLPQLRYIINTYIAGDIASVKGMLAYTGATQPKSVKGADPESRKITLKSVAVGALSLFLITASAAFLYQRVTQSTELLPIFIEQATQDMKATTAGQISYLNPDAQQGEVLFSINANSGDVLNFQLPCDCKVMVADGIFEGATVLPIDDVLSLLQDGAGIRVQTQISVEGLAKVMNGEAAYLDLAEGRSLPVRVATSSATNAAAHRGEAFVPVYLVPVEGALTDADVGKAAQLRLSKPWFNNSFFGFLE